MRDERISGMRLIMQHKFKLILALLATLIMSNCTLLGLNHANLRTDNKPVAQPVLSPASLAEWEAEKPVWRDILARHVYGPYPTALASSLIERRVISEDYADGRAVLEELTIAMGPKEGGVSFHLAIAYPKGIANAPLIIGQTFCSNVSTFAAKGLAQPNRLQGKDPCNNGKGMGYGGAKLIFGRYIARIPEARILDRGYAYASFFASEIIPDSKKSGLSALAEFPVDGAGIKPTSAVSAWAAGYGAALDILEADPRIDAGRTAVFGHSRHAKAALVAGAWDDRIDAIIAHQSGTGGAALNRNKVGESVEAIVRNYPHWFDPAYGSVAGWTTDKTPIFDQHVLLALNAPKPVLLGNGRRDVWSDPNGTFRAAEGADGVYELYGSQGLSQEKMRELNLDAGIVYYLRPGGHAILSEDWDVFLDFLDTAMATGSITAGLN